MESNRLIAHPATPPPGVAAIDARIGTGDAHWLQLRWRIEGAGNVVVPPFAGCRRADGLWQATCFELFVAAGDDGSYCEFNFSPSERWAAYDFAGTRAGMAERPVPRPPVCTWRPGRGVALFDVAIPLAALPSPPWRYGLAAVIEEAGGAKSFWAIAHGSEMPDFHDPACFAARLAAPAEP